MLCIHIIELEHRSIVQGASAYRSDYFKFANKFIYTAVNATRRKYTYYF